MEQAGVTAIVVNWNAGELLAACLRSLSGAREKLPFALDVVVVDNASSDASIDGVESAGQVTVMRNVENRGFGAACNQGAALAVTPYLLFLNPDCEVQEDSLVAAREVLEVRADVGVTSVALNDDTGQVWRSCHRLPRPRHLYARAIGLAQLVPSWFDSAMLSWPHNDDRDVDHVIGAFYMIRRSLFEQLGGFDERFHVYLEDLDLSLRVKQAGYRIRFLAGPVTYHKGGGTSEKVKAMRIFLSTQSRILYAFKHFGAVHGWLHLLVTLACEPFCRMLLLLGRGQWEDLGCVWHAFRRLVGSLSSTLARRRVSG
jgi:GT2 family glycosyltransferase